MGRAANPSDANDVETACKNLIAKFGHYVDNRDYDQVIDLFTKDCVIESPSGSLVGHKDIRAMLDGRALDVQTFHVFNNIVLTHENNSTVSAIYYFTIHRFTESNKGCEPLGSVYGIMKDAFQLVKGQWRISHRVAEVKFATAA